MLHNQDLAKIFNGLALRGKIKLVQTSQVKSWPVISLLLYNYTDYLSKGVYLATSPNQSCYQFHLMKNNEMIWSGDSDGQGFCHEKRKPTQIRSWERRRLTKTVCSRWNFVFLVRFVWSSKSQLRPTECIPCFTNASS